MGRSFEDKLARRQLYSHVPEAEDGAALPDYLAAHFSRFDRAGWIRAIEAGLVTVNDRPALPGATVKRHDRVGYFPPETPEPDAELHYRVLHEDGDLLVIDKPGNLCMHPTGPFFRHTLWHLVGTRYGEIRFVHRLDRETSGLVVAAPRDVRDLKKLIGLSQTASPATITIMTRIDILRFRSPAGTLRFVSGSSE